MDKDPDNASDIMYQSVYALSMEMLRLVHRSILSSSALDKSFVATAKHFQDVSSNLKKHVLEKSWLSKKDSNACIKKIGQIHDLIDICLSCSTQLRTMSDRVISITESMDKNKKLSDISEYIIETLEAGDGGLNDGDDQTD